MSRGKRPESGFTLLEMLAAMVLLAMGLTILMGTLGDAARDQARSVAKGDMAQVARSLMTEHTQQPLQPGIKNGERDGIHWRFECMLRDRLPGVVLYHLSLTLRQGKREEHFTTLRVQRVPQVPAT